MSDDIRKFALLTNFGESLALAQHLQAEDKELMVGMVEDVRDAGEKKAEDDETQKARFKQFDGIVDKMNAETLLGKMEKIKDPDEWFVLCDFNTLWRYADRIKKMGFTKGIFPTQLDAKMEADRDYMKDFVRRFYPRVKVAETEEFKKIEEGIQFIEESDEFWALKGNDTAATTVVPYAKDLDNVKSELVDALQNDRKHYESKGYILERQIRDGANGTAAMIYKDGERVASTIDFEDKRFSDNDGAEMFGCALNVIQSTPLDADINEIAFPAAIDKMAKLHKGLYYMDANLIFKDGEFYYLESCPQRLGYDAVFAECDMSGGVSNYFNSLMRGEVPYQKTWGVGTRGFNMKREEGKVKEGLTMRFSEPEHVWLFGARKENGKIISGAPFGDTESGTDAVAFTESSDDIEYAWQKLGQVVEDFSLKGMYTRKDFSVLDPHIEGIQKFTKPKQVDSEKK